MSTPSTPSTTSYPDFVSRLFKSGEELKQGFIWASYRKLDSLHAIIGINTEVVEVLQASKKGDLNNLREELGDLWFYITALLQARQLSYDDDVVDFYPHMPALEAASILLDLAKKECIYGIDLNEGQIRKFDMALSSIRARVATEAAAIGLSREELEQSNMAKLLKRYPGATYSNQAAAARLDKIGEHDDNA